MGRNPFTPSFGVTPPLLVGRDHEIAAFIEALESGPGAPGRATLFTGARGSGKTVVLNAVEDVARERGWLVVSETARPGVAEQITRTTISSLLREHAPDPETSRWTGVNVQAVGFGAGVEREHAEKYPGQASLRSQLEALTDALRPHQTGVLISLDEVHSAAVPDLREITHAVQHAFRDGRDLAFVAAGLPSAVEDLLNDDVMTFLRRAERFTLGPVTPDQVRAALSEPIVAAGRTIHADALRAAVDGTRGYPFLVQLIGYHVWNVSPESEQITGQDVRTGITRAADRVGDLVHAPGVAGLSDVDRSFLAAMAVDDGPSQMSAITQRLGVTTGYASQYRLRLIAAELIEPVGRGRVTFTLPYLRDYLRQHSSARDDTSDPSHRPGG